VLLGIYLIVVGLNTKFNRINLKLRPLNVAPPQSHMKFQTF
jgi:hypothetical protein